METVQHISTTDNIDELNHLYKASGSQYAAKDAGNNSYFLIVLFVDTYNFRTICLII